MIDDKTVVNWDLSPNPDVSEETVSDVFSRIRNFILEEYKPTFYTRCYVMPAWIADKLFENVPEDEKKND